MTSDYYPWGHIIWDDDGGASESECDHEYVNVGFTSVIMACKHCGINQEPDDDSTT